MMKALVKYAPGAHGMEIRDVPMPEPENGEALVKVASVGVCGTDLKIQEGKFETTVPVILGHEFSGIITKAPADSGFAEGDRVLCEQHFFACGSCYYCSSGQRQWCRHKRSPGYASDGAFAEYIAAPLSLLHRLPEHVTMDEAAIVEPMGIAAFAMLERCTIQPEDTVLLLGCGPIALLALQMAKAAGAAKVMVTGIDADEKRRFALAKAFGAHITINAQKEDVAQAVMDVTGGLGADVVADFSGAASAILQGLRLVRKGGRFLACGMPPGDIAIPWSELVLRAISVIFSYSANYMSWRRCLSYIERGVVRLDAFTENTFPLTRWVEAFDCARGGEALKAIIHPNEL